MRRARNTRRASLFLKGGFLMSVSWLTCINLLQSQLFFTCVEPGGGSSMTH